MTRLKLLALAAATLATSTPWPRLDEALKNYPAIHARETARLKAGQPAKFVLVVCYHGLGNRHHALVSAFALALARDAALYVDWPDQRCNKWAQAGDAAACEASGLEDLFARPPFDWTALASGHKDKGSRLRGRVRGEKKYAWAGWRLSHGSEWQVQEADLEEGPWNASVVVRTDHHFLHGVLCNAQIKSKSLFPPDDALYVQRTLEAYLLKPAASITQAVDEALGSQGCGVGLHLRRADEHPEWDPHETWERIAPLLSKTEGGLFVASDGYSAPFRAALERAAKAAGAVVVPSPTTPTPSMLALAENHVLARCKHLVPTNASTFFNIAAVRAMGHSRAVRDVYTCPSVFGPQFGYRADAAPEGRFPHRCPPEAREASPLTGNAIPCRFTPKCPRHAVRGSSQFRHGQIGDEGLDFFFAGPVQCGNQAASRVRVDGVESTQSFTARHFYFCTGLEADYAGNARDANMFG